MTGDRSAAPLADLTWPDITASGGRTLVVPLGSLEQHGPHLPLDTDAFLAGAFADLLRRERPGAAVAPALPFGASGEHADFPGTLSMGTTALAGVLVELVRDAARDWDCVLFANGHGGNADALAAALRTATAEGRRAAAVHLGVAGMDAHAGHAETSMMLHLAPHRVLVERIAPGLTTPVGELDLRSTGLRAVTPTGVLGDSTTATAEAGRLLVGRVLAKLVVAYDGCTLT